jgi:hypothetical protein
MSAQGKIGLFWQLSAIAILCFALGLWIRRREVAARKWPQAEGRIVTSRIVTGPVRGGTTSEPVIEYEFKYQGRSFKSSHWRAGNFTIGNLATAQEVTDRYPAGSLATVYVNQRQPLKSVLEATSSSLCWLPFCCGIFCLGLILLGIFSIVINSRPLRP